MRRFPLDQLYWQEFEELVVLLCDKVLGIGTLKFSTGKDGGRDAVFRGKAESYPSSSKPWEGTIVIQAKHTENPIASCSDREFERLLDNEVNKRLKRLVAEKQADYYLLFTNRKLTAPKEATLTSLIQKTLDIENAIIGVETIHVWLKNHTEIVKSMKLYDLLMPLQFDPQDLRDIILKFSKVRGQLAENANRKKAELKQLKLEEKNELNELNKEYFDLMRKGSFSFFNNISEFLKNPINRKYLNAYDNTVSDLQAVITLKRSKYSDFEAVIESLYDFVRKEFPELKERRRLIRVFLHYMYCNCDIGLDG